ncbi:MAG: heavy metal transport/detoxification protein [Nodosilinea sp.]
MSLTFKVLNLGNSQSMKDLEDLILTSEPDAIVNIDSQAKTVTIDSEASEETFNQLITAAGHKIALA